MLTQDVQTHTTYSDGSVTIAEMVEGAISNKLELLVITDHAKGWVANGRQIEFFPTYEKFKEYIDQIKKSKIYYDGHIQILSGLEIEIDIFGKCKLDPGILEYEKNNPLEEKYGVDILLGCIHSESFEEDCVQYGIENEQRRTVLVDNVINLICNKKIDVVAHIFQVVHGQFSNNFSKEEAGRIIDAFEAEWKSGHSIHLEINGKKYPNYEQWNHNKYESGEISINDLQFLTMYKERGGKFVLGSDAHSVAGLTNTDFTILDVFTLNESDIVNLAKNEKQNLR